VPGALVAAVLSIELLGSGTSPWALLVLKSPGEDPTAQDDGAIMLTTALQARGIEVLSPSALRRELVGQARVVVEGVPPAAEAFALASERAFDEGRFEEAAHQASLATGELARGPRGSAIEERWRECQVVWGAALASMGRGGQAAGHFRAALERDSRFIPSADRFAPPVRRRLERVRRELSRAPPSTTLAVSGTAGATVFLDGLAQGQAPAALHGSSGRQAWLWLERGGRRSLAHPVTFGIPLVPIEVDADASLAGLVRQEATSDRPVVALESVAEPARSEALVSDLHARVSAPVLLVLERCPGSDCQRIWVAVGGRIDRVERLAPRGAPPAGWDLDAQALIALVALQGSPATSEVARSTAVPPAGTEEPRATRPLEPASVMNPPVVSAALRPPAPVSLQSTGNGPSPVVWGLLATAAVGIGVCIGVAVASSSHPALAVSIQSSPGHP
jgi:hypothetical protein